MTTVRELLFGVVPHGQTIGKVEQAAERLVSASPAADSPVARAVMTKVSELLNFEISDVLVGAWQTRSALATAARDTWNKPGTTRVVTIKTYSLPWEYEMDVDVNVNGKTVTTLTFVLSLSIEVTALAATVGKGRLTHLNAGAGVARAELHLKESALEQQATIAQGERAFDLRMEVKVGDGIPLIKEARTPPKA